MDSLELVRRKRAHRYPAPVLALTKFLKQNSRMWPLVADYLRGVCVDSEPETRLRTFDALSCQHFLAKPEYRGQRDRLRRLLDDLYALSSEKTDPRTLFLEYLLYEMGPYGEKLRRAADLQREYQCSVYRWSEDGVRTKAVDSDATFDVLFLCAEAFEGHECKVKIWNYIPMYQDIGQWDEDTIQKLRFMEATHTVVMKTGRTSAVYVTGLDRALLPIQQNLRRNGFTGIQLLGADELEELLA